MGDTQSIERRRTQKRSGTDVQGSLRKDWLSVFPTPWPAIIVLVTVPLVMLAALGGDSGLSQRAFQGKCWFPDISHGEDQHSNSCSPIEGLLEAPKVSESLIVSQLEGLVDYKHELFDIYELGLPISSNASRLTSLAGDTPVEPDRGPLLGHAKVVWTAGEAVHHQMSPIRRELSSVIRNALHMSHVEHEAWLGKSQAAAEIASRTERFLDRLSQIVGEQLVKPQPLLDSLQSLRDNLPFLLDDIAISREEQCEGFIAEPSVWWHWLHRAFEQKHWSFVCYESDAKLAKDVQTLTSEAERVMQAIGVLVEKYSKLVLEISTTRDRVRQYLTFPARKQEPLIPAEWVHDLETLHEGFARLEYKRLLVKQELAERHRSSEDEKSRYHAESDKSWEELRLPCLTPAEKVTVSLVLSLLLYGFYAVRGF